MFPIAGKHMQLSQDTEEVATFYAKMLEHDYTTRDVFNNNFMKDWRKVTSYIALWGQHYHLSFWELCCFFQFVQDEKLCVTISPHKVNIEIKKK